jgi:hypothetical protein
MAIPFASRDGQMVVAILVIPIRSHEDGALLKFVLPLKSVLSPTLPIKTLAVIGRSLPTTAALVGGVVIPTAVLGRTRSGRNIPVITKAPTTSSVTGM